MNDAKSKLKTAVFGGGCFWCTEAVFQMLKGVVAVSPGFAGGRPSDDGRNPTYEQVSEGITGHAEVIQIIYDPHKITYRDLLTVFFATHDGSTLNRQGNDVGTQYRSIVLYTSEAEKKEAEDVIQEINRSNPTGKVLVTEVKPLEVFYEAETYHQDYFAKHQGNPYCELVINPKLEKVQQKFSGLLKTHGTQA